MGRSLLNIAAGPLRVNVTRALKRDIHKIAIHHQALGLHLRRTVNTGRFCSYTPDPRLPISWRSCLFRKMFHAMEQLFPHLSRRIGVTQDRHPQSIRLPPHVLVQSDLRITRAMLLPVLEADPER